MKKRVYGSVALAMLISLVGCGSDDTTTNSLTGKAVDGYLSGSTVCLDLNNNNSCDADEPTAVTDSNGSFELAVDVNSDAKIIVYGGIDTDTNAKFNGILKAPSDETNVTPLTTLVASLMDEGSSKEEAISSVATLLDLDPQDVTKDPVASAKENENILKSALKVQKLVEVVAKESGDEQNFSTVLKNIATSLKNSTDMETLIDNISDSTTLKNSLKAMNSSIDSLKLDNTKEYALKIDMMKDEVVSKAIIEKKEISSQDLNSMLQSCELDPNLDDSNYTDVAPNNGKNIEYNNIGTTVSDIESAFNYARSLDSTVNKALTLPSQEVWDSLSKEEQALYILNKERLDRGLKPFEGVVSMNTKFNSTNPTTLSEVAQGYANVLYTKTTLDHNLDGDVTSRLNRVEAIKNGSEYIPYNESLYAEGNSFKLDSIPLIKAVYNWIYADEKPAAGKPWGHRAMCLMKVPNDDFGKKGAEGIVGFGLVQGENYAMTPNYKSSIVVMNIINPTSSWNQDYKELTLCLGSNVNTKFIRDLNGTIYDTTTQLTWQDTNLTILNRSDATDFCSNLVLDGYDDWRLSSSSELSEFYKSTKEAGITPNLAQINSNLLVASDGFVLTQNGALKYKKDFASISTEFSDAQTGEVKCVRGEAQSSDTSDGNSKITLDKTKNLAIQNDKNLMWVNQYKLIGKMSTTYGLIACQNSDFAGFNNWRLPTADELSSFHKTAKDENVTLNYYASYCTAEITSDGSSKYVWVQKDSPEQNLKIGDIINFSGSAGVRCVRDTDSSEDLDTIPPKRPVITYSGEHLIDIEKRGDEEDVLTYSDLEINATTLDNNGTDLDYTIVITGEPSSTLYTVDYDGNLKDKIGTLGENGIEYTIKAEDRTYTYSDRKNWYYDSVADFVLVDDANNTSKINRVFIYLYE